MDNSQSDGSTTTTSDEEEETEGGDVDGLVTRLPLAPANGAGLRLEDTANVSFVDKAVVVQAWTSEGLRVYWWSASTNMFIDAIKLPPGDHDGEVAFGSDYILADRGDGQVWVLPPKLMLLPECCTPNPEQCAAFIMRAQANRVAMTSCNHCLRTFLPGHWEAPCFTRILKDSAEDQDVPTLSPDGRVAYVASICERPPRSGAQPGPVARSSPRGAIVRAFDADTGAVLAETPLLRHVLYSASSNSLGVLAREPDMIVWNGKNNLSISSDGALLAVLLRASSPPPSFQNVEMANRSDGAGTSYALYILKTAHLSVWLEVRLPRPSRTQQGGRRVGKRRFAPVIRHVEFICTRPNLLALSDRSTVHVAAFVEGEKLLRLLASLPWAVTSIASSPDGELLAGALSDAVVLCDLPALLHRARSRRWGMVMLRALWQTGRAAADLDESLESQERASALLVESTLGLLFRSVMEFLE